MIAEPYRRVLAIPGVGRLMSIAVLARIPVTAGGLTLTLHVLWDLHLGYAAAGLIAAAATVSSAIGAPLLGRMVDRLGVRPVLAVTTGCEALFWFLAPSVGYRALLVLTAITGLFRLPIFSIVRQSLAAMVPQAQRREGYAVDSMSVELSYLVGPALAVFIATRYSAHATMLMIGAATVAGGLALIALNPLVHGEETSSGAPMTSSRILTPELLAQLAVAAAATIVLSGSDVALVAALRASGQTSWTGLLFACWCGSSLIGGFGYGLARRPPSPAALVGLLGATTIPVGLAGAWPWLGLAIIPAGLFCAPTLAASADAVSRLTAPGTSGEIMGWHGAAMTAGMALGAPLAGAIIDASNASAGLAAVGAVGVAVSVVLLCLGTRSQRNRRLEPPATDQNARSRPDAFELASGQRS